MLTWTIDQDREILRLCRTSGARYKTFKILSKSFSDKTDTQVHIYEEEFEPLLCEVVQNSVNPSFVIILNPNFYFFRILFK